MISIAASFRFRLPVRWFFCCSVRNSDSIIFMSIRFYHSVLAHWLRKSLLMTLAILIDNTLTKNDVYRDNKLMVDYLHKIYVQSACTYAPLLSEQHLMKRCEKKLDSNLPCLEFVFSWLGLGRKGKHNKNSLAHYPHYSIPYRCLGDVLVID